MICPACQSKRSKVLQSRTTTIDGDDFIRRRRKCCKCGHRFTTYEGYDTPDPENTIRICEARKLARRLQETLSA